MKDYIQFLLESKTSKIKVYHGTNKKFNKLDTSVNAQGSDFGSGAYFTNDLQRAKVYGKFVYEAYITLKDPVILKNRYDMNDIWDYLIDEKAEGIVENDIEMKEYIISKGADGIVINNPIMGKKSDEIWYVVYYNNQIKNFKLISE